MRPPPPCFSLFFFNDTATTEIYTFSLHDALPISPAPRSTPASRSPQSHHWRCFAKSEERTSDLAARSRLSSPPLPEKTTRCPPPRPTSLCCHRRCDPCTAAPRVASPRLRGCQCAA